MTKKINEIDPKAPDVATAQAGREAQRAEAATHFKLNLKKAPEFVDEKEFGNKIPLDPDPGEKDPDSDDPAADDEHVGEAHELDPGIAGNAGEKEPGVPEGDHKNY